MNMPRQQAVQEATQAQQLKQLRSNKVLSGLRTGIDLLEDKNVVAPIAMHGGLTDLEWLLRGLLGGQFSIDLDPEGQQAARPLTASAKKIASTDLDDEEGEGSNGNGSV